jgi:predicted nucleic acid-binding protein
VTTSTLVDSNIFLDVLSGGSHHQWSRDALTVAGGEGELIVNVVIWSEISARFATEDHLAGALMGLVLQRREISFDAAFAAGKAHLAYRRTGGTRERTLPDFLVGAHAAVSGYRLLTRDPARYRTYFPSLSVIAPDTHP